MKAVDARERLGAHDCARDDVQIVDAMRRDPRLLRRLAFLLAEPLEVDANALDAGGISRDRDGCVRGPQRQDERVS